MSRSTRTTWWIAAALVMLTDCGGPGATLRTAVPSSGAPRAIDACAKVMRVRIADPELHGNVAQLEERLTDLVYQMVRDGRYFRSVSLHDGCGASDDIVLRVVLYRYRAGWSYHPAYQPLFALTLGAYKALGGPVSVYTTDAAGRLVLQRGGSEPIGEVRTELTTRASQNAYRKVDTTEPDARLVQQLLDRGLALVDAAVRR